MPDRPLLILPSPGTPDKRGMKTGGGGMPRVPSRARQGERLSPRFDALRQAMDARTVRLRTEAAGIVPEEVVVLETVGAVEDFVVAVRRIDGLEWLGEIEEEEIPPDDDFYVVDRKGIRRPEKAMRGRVFLVFTNQRALQQILSLWSTWRAERALGPGLSKWAAAFSQLRDIRAWGVRDRLIETGVLDDWSERIEHDEQVVPCEVEFWYRQDPERRRSAQDRVASLVQHLGGRVVEQAVVEDIAYHASLVELPAGAVQPLIAGAFDLALVQCEQIQFFRASGQMAAIVSDDVSHSPAASVVPPAIALSEPVVALFDGLPLQNHRCLADRLIVDDPDGYEAEYSATERRHGTSMASLIIHGDLNSGDPALARNLYVRPILRPDVRAWIQPRPEAVSDRTLIVDLIHRAVRRLFQGEGVQPPAAPQVCVINLSIGIRDRPFDGTLSPLSRLLDWLAWTYKVLFIVSAGNHLQDIEIPLPRSQLSSLSPDDLQSHILRSVAADTRNRRLLSPAEAINVLTVGAIHEDAWTGPTAPSGLHPYVVPGLPSPYNAQGMGYRRTIKPEILAPGGRALLQEGPGATANTILRLANFTSPPGQRAASPGPTVGELESTWYTRGTSNAAAMASRASCQLYDMLEDLQREPGGELIGMIPRSVWLKALIAHSAMWNSAGKILDDILRTPDNSRQFKEYVTRLLGYGKMQLERVQQCTRHRVSALGAGILQADQAHLHQFPLPPSLSGHRLWRRLVVTLAWLTPVNSAHRAWRRADLWFTPVNTHLPVSRREAEWRAVQRGTLQHEVFEGERAAAFVDGDNIELRVSCRADAGALEEAVPYALAITLEVSDQLAVDIYNEVRARVHARVRVAQGA